MGLRLIGRLALVVATCALLAGLATAAWLYLPPAARARVPAGLQANLWRLTLLHIGVCGALCYAAYAGRELAAAASRRAAHWLGVGFAALMWATPSLGTACGLAAWAVRGGDADRAFTLALAAFVLWSLAFVFAGALAMEPTRPAGDP